MKKILAIIILCATLLMPINAKAISASALSSLSIEGIGEVKNNRTYNFTSSLGYVEVTATPSDSSYTVTGDGKINCEEGLNKIEVVVTDPSDNSTKVYTININYSSSGTKTSSNSDTNTGSTSEKVENPNTGSFINVTAIGVITALFLLILLKSNKKIKFYKI